jgi:hypothetical protein
MNIFKRLFRKKEKKPIPTAKSQWVAPPLTRSYSRTTKEDDSSFGTSFAIAAATDNPILGFAVGGDLTGSLLGASLIDSNDFGGGSFGGAGSSGSWDDSSSTSTDSSSYDSGSSYDSSSSDSSSSSFD